MQKKYCSRCSKEKDLSLFNKKSTSNDGLQPFCKDCNKAYHKEHYKLNKTNYITKSRIQRGKNKIAWDEFKATLSCKICGEDHPACLEFHHKNPDEKEFNLGQAYFRYGKEKIKIELEKCDILCANCHRIEHYNNRVSSNWTRNPDFQSV